MPHVNGLEATGEIHRALPSVEVLIFTGTQSRHALAGRLSLTSPRLPAEERRPEDVTTRARVDPGASSFPFPRHHRGVRRHRPDQWQPRHPYRPRKRNRLPHRQLQIDQANRRRAGPQHQNHRDPPGARLRQAPGAFRGRAGPLRFAGWAGSSFRDGDDCACGTQIKLLTKIHALTPLNLPHFRRRLCLRDSDQILTKIHALILSNPDPFPIDAVVGYAFRVGLVEL